MWSVFFVFLSYLDRNVVKGALDTEESEQMLSALNRTFCAKMSIAGENLLYQVSDGAEVVRSVVSPAGRLVNCSITAKHLQVKSFMQECMLGMRARPDTPFTRMDEVRSMCREFAERMEGAKTDTGDEPEVQDKTLRRSKRGFTYPGTLWCGAGNMADDYEQLGQFAETDSCCRIHDHCPHVIHAFSSNYGYTNFKWHSICHCDCDNALKACLRKVNDTSSRVVGQAFFNVIGVPCFDLAYEEQCAERHWYGMCKRYEKFPIAVLREAVPYDFGGISVIDQLTMAPPHTRDSKNSKGDGKAENPTQSTMLGPEEPSLRNVVTAAEDFIKVLATVSTSQSSNAESDKSEAQNSEKKKKKKKRKNSGKNKKTSKKARGKAKGGKRKQEAVVKIEEGAAVSTSGSKAEDLKTLSNFISESQGRDQSRSNTNRGADKRFELEGKDEPSNEVMKDEPAMEEQTVSTVSDVKGPAELESAMTTEEVTLSPAVMTVSPLKTKHRRQRKGKSEKRRKSSLLHLEQLSVTPAETSSAVSVHTDVTVTTTQRPEQPGLREMQLVVSTASPPTVIPTVKRNRSKKGGDSEERKNRRRGSSSSPILLSAPQNSSEDNLEGVLLTGAPTVPSIPQRQLSPRPHVYRGKTQTTGLKSSFSILKREREKRLRKRRRKTLPPPSENPPFPLNASENVLQTPDSGAAPTSESTTAAQRREPVNDWRVSTTAASTSGTKRHRQQARKQTKPRRKAGVDALSDATSDAKQTGSVTFTAKPSTTATTEALGSVKHPVTTSAAHTWSPIHWTIERAKAQFAWKKRRKAALLSRQP